MSERKVNWQGYARLDALRGTRAGDISESDYKRVLPECMEESNLPIAPYLASAEIYPIFQQNNWIEVPDDAGWVDIDKKISDTDYDLMKPVLRLASKFLSSPELMQYFIGLLARPQESFTTPAI